MTNGSTEKQQINDFPPGYNTAITISTPDAAPSQTAVLIENEQLRAVENEKSLLTEHRRQQEEANIFWRGPEAACGGFIAGVIIILLLLKYLPDVRY